MSDKLTVPELDLKAIQERANEAAMKGALEVVTEHYSGYNSPFKNGIKEALKNKGFGYSLTLPDVMALINDSLTEEIDRIANTAISKSFLPLVTEFLTRQKGEMLFSEVLQEFIKAVGFDWDDDEPEDFSVELDRDRGSFQTFKISNGEKSYDLGLFCSKKQEDPKDNTWTIYHLPTNDYGNSNNQTMKISLDGGATLELPYTRDILRDKFLSFCAGLQMAKTKITMDVLEFNDDLFPEREDCHC
jgi:hypothetical protein